MISDDMREKLAAVQHEIWSHWTEYMFTQGWFNLDENGERQWYMPAYTLGGWHRQMVTPYTDLTDAERKSDREQADKVIAVLDSLPAIPQPPALPWDYAPHYALFGTVDADGRIRWFRSKPIIEQNSSMWAPDTENLDEHDARAHWSSLGGYIDLPPNCDWRDTLQERPQPQAEA